uniref:Potassium channel tetramerisation-type BTB domain-containing protein n=1 Tax=viral metagenome TaxID=1070528 RepID=A0A6C0C779_9ZZZZ
MADCPDENEIFIERSPKIFEHVLALLIDHLYSYPYKYHSELDYYLIPHDINLLYDPTDKIIGLKNQFEKIAQDVTQIKGKISYLKCEEYNIKCPESSCYEICMLRPMPTCEHHRGKCCHSYCEKICSGRYRTVLCYNEIDDDRVYCEEHMP